MAIDQGPCFQCERVYRKFKILGDKLSGSGHAVAGGVYMEQIYFWTISPKVSAIYTLYTFLVTHLIYHAGGEQH